MLVISTGAYPTYVDCDLNIDKAGSQTWAIMTTSNTVMGAVPEDVTNLATVSSTSYTSSSDQISITFANLGVQGLVSVSSGTLQDATECSNKKITWQTGGPTTKNWNAGTSVGDVNIHIATAGGFGLLKRQTITIAHLLTCTNGANGAPCQNGGSSTGMTGNCGCSCVAGYTGNNCETNTNECNPDPCVNGACVDGVNSYICMCITGWSGTDCETNIDDCSPNPCLNGGTCTDGVNSYTCACAAGYSDATCSTNIDDCTPNPCLNGGTCTDGSNSFTCACAATFSGTTCTTIDDDCSPNPCLNGGVCLDGVDTYVCTCAPGYNGIDCAVDIDECSPNPCLNGGTCTDGPNSFTCACVNGYTGATCITNPGFCPSDRCKNGGTCVLVGDDYDCVCAAGYSGKHCFSNEVLQAKLPTGFMAHWMSTNVSAKGARGLFVTKGGSVLAISRKSSPRKIVLVGEVAADIVVEDTLTHGLVVFEDYVYASSNSMVYRWPYQDGQTTLISNTLKKIVIKNINQDSSGVFVDQWHVTRTLVFDEDGLLYVSVGAYDNVDANSFRAKIRRFNVSSFPVGGLDFVTGEIFADGLRNEVGLAFDSFGVLWGVENGADNLNRYDLGGDIHNENPAEELNRFDVVGQHYGYPYCWTAFNLPGHDRGSVLAWPSTMTDGIHDDDWCRLHTVAPTMSMQAHSAPLGIVFFNASKHLPGHCSRSFPAWMDGDAFVAFHGSWNRDVPTGYKVVRIHMRSNGLPSTNAKPIDFFSHQGADVKWPSGIRPVDVKFDKCNRLLVSSDGTDGNGDGVIVIDYTVPPEKAVDLPMWVYFLFVFFVIVVIAIICFRIPKSNGRTRR